MSNDPKVLPFRRPILTPSPSEQTITVSYPHLLLLFDAFTDCAQALQYKLTVLDDLYGLLPGNDEVGTRKLRTRSQDEQQAVAADADRSASQRTKACAQGDLSPVSDFQREESQHADARQARLGRQPSASGHRTCVVTQGRIEARWSHRCHTGRYGSFAGR